MENRVMQDTFIQVRNIELGAGIPKICVPIVAVNDEGIEEAAAAASEKNPDMIEFRGDLYEKLEDKEALINVLKKLRGILGDRVMLFTIRTVAEGGNADLTPAEYMDICSKVCESRLVDLIDVEVFMQEGLLDEMCKVAHSNGIRVVASSHDFEKTPDRTEILRRLMYMDEHGADIPKIAVMPCVEEDVLTLLSATLDYRRQGTGKPVITMSMGGSGLISRLAVELFGSAVTFATAGEASAPGQIPIEDVRKVLDVIHKSL